MSELKLKIKTDENRVDSMYNFK